MLEQYDSKCVTTRDRMKQGLGPRAFSCAIASVLSHLLRPRTALQAYFAHLAPPLVSSVTICLHYCRLFAAKCAKCSQGFSKNDFVMRARNKIFHTDCFVCVACERQLVSGDEFALRDDGLFCKVRYHLSHLFILRLHPVTRTNMLPRLVVPCLVLTGRPRGPREARHQVRAVAERLQRALAQSR